MTDDPMPSDPTRSAPESPPGDGEPDGEIPLGQRLFDRPFLLLALCVVVMFVFYTGWGLVEIFTLSEAPLP